MPTLLRFASLLLVGSVLSSPECFAAIIYDENTDGSISTNNLSPTDLTLPSLSNPAGGPLALGISSLRGVVENALGFGDVDVFMFQIQPGTKLIEITIPEYQSADAIAVMGLNNDSFFPFNPSTFNNTLTLISLQQIIGVAQFGDGWVNTTGVNGRDLLNGTDALLTGANLIGSRSSGFKAFETYGPSDKFDEVGPGTYTVYVQQTGSNTEYQMNFNVVQSVPEPSSVALVSLAAVAVIARRRRR